MGETTQRVGWLSGPLRGELDLDTAARLEPLLLDFAAANDGPSVVYDCSRLRFIDSSGVNMLERIAKRSAKQVRLVNLNPNCRRIFDVLGLGEQFGIE